MAIVGHIAATLAGAKIEDQPEWLRGAGIDVGLRALKDAIKERKAQPEGHRARGVPPRARETALGSGRPAWVRSSLEVDTFGLDLDAAVVRLPPEDAQSEVLDRVRRITGVVEIVHTFDHGLLIRLVFAGRQRREQLRSAFEQLSEGMQWSDVRAEDRSPAPSTWLGIARQIAAGEGRAIEQ